MGAVGLAVVLAVWNFASCAYPRIGTGGRVADLPDLGTVRDRATGRHRHHRPRPRPRGGSGPGCIGRAGATAGSFGGVALILLEAGSAQGGLKAAIMAITPDSVTLSGLLVQTHFTPGIGQTVS